MPQLDVTHVAADRFLVRIRDHAVVVDQPEDAGGDDAGPTPTELFVAGLASCVGFYAERFLRRHRLSPMGLGVDCHYEMNDGRPARVARIDLRVTAPTLPAARRAAFMAVIEHCTVHNTLQMPPTVLVTVAGEVAA